MKIMQKFSIKNGLVSESVKYPLLFFIGLLSVFYVYSFFHPIPTPSRIADTVGLGSSYLDIGDRSFYFHDNNSSYGYGQKMEILKVVSISLHTKFFSLYNFSIRFWNNGLEYSCNFFSKLIKFAHYFYR